MKLGAIVDAIMRMFGRHTQEKVDPALEDKRARLNKELDRLEMLGVESRVRGRYSGNSKSSGDNVDYNRDHRSPSP
jgi:hypothetical protein